ncbi:UNVERIFIED_CONTAM: hypothetical protein Scaly_0199800 [Sesamum calycinum]|uniref:E3 ubiquitin-protein ligase RMA n=1 Tax=Sesamum calycinum TaxID=2727403 RepID=A0AAW2SYY6_9LAMI
MDDGNLIDVNSMGLDLNREPMDPPQRSAARVGSLLDELETPHGGIEERIRQLEGVSARARQRQRWRQERSSVEIGHFSSEMMANVDGEEVPDVDSTSKECPVCKGEVSNGTIIPIYGNGGGEPVYETESGLKIPPRPKARS